MYAGSSGSNYGVNKNSRGNGNGKWQGLPPTVGHARNARHINIEAGGNNRDVVFCMNQLGGVGRISNMFATTADGVKDCGCILPSNIKNALQQLSNYASQQGLRLGLAGVNETVQSDLPKTSGLTPFDTSFPPEMQQYVSLINGLGLKFQVTAANDVQKHVVVMLTHTDAKLLAEGGFGFPVSSLCDSIYAFGNCGVPCCSCLDCNNGQNPADRDKMWCWFCSSGGGGAAADAAARQACIDCSGCPQQGDYCYGVTPADRAWVDCSGCIMDCSGNQIYTV